MKGVMGKLGVNVLKRFVFLLLLVQGVTYAGPKGMGFDVMYSQPVADPDSIHDEGGYSINLGFGFGGDQASNTFMVNYLLRPLSPRSNLSLGFTYFNYDSSFSQNGAAASVTASEVQFNLFYTRSLIRNNLDSDGFESWRPSNWNLSYYAGVGYAPAKLDVKVSGPAALPQVPKLGDLRAGTGQEVSGTSLPLLVGLVGSYSLSSQHGLEVFLNIDQHFSVEDAGFDGSYSPAINLGGNYYYRANTSNFFPFEYSVGIIANSMSNDIEDGPGIGMTFGVRKRY